MTGLGGRFRKKKIFFLCFTCTGTGDFVSLRSLRYG